MNKLLSITILIFSFTTVIFSQENMQDVIYLKNGSVIKGIIIEQIPNQTIKIQTEGGSIFVYNMSEVKKITKEVKKTNINNSKISSFHTRKMIDLLGLTFTYGLTVAGDAIIDEGIDVPVLLVPVVGPFIAMGDEDQEDYTTVFLISGLIQTAFILDYFITSNKINSLEKKFTYFINPSPNNVTVSLAYHF